MKEIKVLLLDMYLTHTGPVLDSAPTAAVAKPAGTTQLPILITDSKRTSRPGWVGCHNCGQPGHHSKNCTNAQVPGASPAKDKEGKVQLI